MFLLLAVVPLGGSAGLVLSGAWRVQQDLQNGIPFLVPVLYLSLHTHPQCEFHLFYPMVPRVRIHRRLFYLVPHPGSFVSEAHGAPPVGPRSRLSKMLALELVSPSE